MWYSSRSRSRVPSTCVGRRGAHGSARRQAAFRPALAALEVSTLTVLKNNDSGPGSLRAEIAAAHAGDAIRFAGKLDGQTITLTGGELVGGENRDKNNTPGLFPSPAPA